jgi:type II restriction enzyme
MKFDFCIGNPPYQEESQAETTRMLPVYDKFMDAAYKISDVVELITPARFLFNAGQTQKMWNEKMLSDKHLKVLYYEPNATRVFANTDIKGGVAVTCYNKNQEFEPIGIFVPWEELTSIRMKAGAKTPSDSLTDIAESSPTYDLKNLYKDYPDYKKYVADNGRHSQLKTNVLNINPIFTEKPSNDDDLKIYGLVDGKRGYKYCRKQYIKQAHKSLSKYKVLIPKAVGSGQLNDTFPEIFVVGKNAGFTQTYISIGMFDTEEEAKCLEKYIKTKFCRVLLYVLKVTQDNLPAVWRYIPKQDFTSSSDIDWSVSIANIDKQLYKKYGLTDEEISFIETNVKEME